MLTSLQELAALKDAKTSRVRMDATARLRRILGVLSLVAASHRKAATGISTREAGANSVASPWPISPSPPPSFPPSLWPNGHAARLRFSSEQRRTSFVSGQMFLPARHIWVLRL